jgi:hypothetical protein
MRIALALGVFCVGCALLPLRENSQMREASLHDAYLVAHGMATSYVERPDANPSVVQQLEVLDNRAAAAMRTDDSTATAEAVAALTTYAARQAESDTATSPNP